MGASGRPYATLSQFEPIAGVAMLNKNMNLLNLIRIRRATMRMEINLIALPVMCAVLWPVTIAISTPI